MGLATVVLRAAASVSAWGGLGSILGDGAPYAVADGPARVVFGAR
jgi:hypothetical protein